MGIYVNSVLAYQVSGGTLNTTLTLKPGNYYTVVEEWDNCGGASTTPVSITVPSGSTLNGVSVTSPLNGSTVTSPVTYVASAGSATCAQGVAAMGVYVNNALAYQVNGSSLKAPITLRPGINNTVVQEWDNCGGSVMTPINVTAATAQNGVSVTSPVNGSTVASPVRYVASAAATSCAQGVAAMGIYVNSALVYKTSGSALSTPVTLNTGLNNTVVQEWDNCGGSTTSTVDVTVPSTSTQNGVTVTAPLSGSTVGSPVKFIATAGSTSCAEGIAAMGIYINSSLAYKANGSSLATSLTLAAGSYNAVVQAWDNCGSALTSPLAIKVSSSANTPTSIAITPNPATIALGATLQFAATATFSDGTTQDVTSRATWAAANTAVASVSTSALLTPIAAGTTALTATYNGTAGSSPLTVAIAPGTGVNIPTWHADVSRSGLNAAELTLTPANVNPQTFGRMFSYLLDGYVYGEPLLASALTIAGVKHNVLYAATENDTVYALDADTYGAPLWQSSLLMAGETPMTTGPVQPVQGITSTPVMDLSTNTLYVVSAQQPQYGVATFRLNALDLTTGAQKFGGPVLLNASIPGTNASAVNGLVNLTTSCVQRAALLLANGNVYIGMGGCTTGWLLAYNATTLAQVAVFNSSPNLSGEGTYASAGGIWMGAGGPAADAAGNIYAVTGNGPWDGESAWSDSVLKFSAQLKVTDSFTPAGYQFMNCQDADLGSGGILLIPGTGNLVAGGKTGKLYLLNSGKLGGQQPSDSGAAQTLFFGSGLADSYTASCTDTSGIHTTDIISYENFGTSAFFNNSVYLGATPTTAIVPAGIRQFSLNGTLAPVSTSTVNMQMNTNGASPFISANGSQNGIVWVIDQGQPLQNGGGVAPTSATLRAFDASDLTNSLYDSSSNIQDVPGYGIKFTSPIIANGKVYMSTGHDLTTATNPRGEIDVYGLR